MDSDTSKRSRGRPQKLNRGNIVNTAMNSYWADGVDGVSLNEICRRACVSKPGVYREFQSEDGLMKAALIQYFEQVLNPLLQSIVQRDPFRDAMNALISLATAGRVNDSTPAGCLIVKMNNSQTHIGAATKHQLDQYNKHMLSVYKSWVERAKARGEFTPHMSNRFAAVYINAQVSNALAQQERGDDAQTIRDILNTAFSVFYE